MFLIFSNHFDVLMSKMIFKKLKNIIDIHFDTKNYLKSKPQPHYQTSFKCLNYEFPCLDCMQS